MSPLPAIAIGNILYITALGVIIPGLPYGMLSLGGGVFDAIVIFAVFSTASFLASPVWGKFSDRHGRKKSLLLSVLLTFFAYLALAAAQDIWQAYAARAFAGLSAGWMGVSQAFIVDATDAKNRSKGMGIWGASLGAGFTLGAGVSGIVLSFSNSREILDISILALISAGLCCVLMLFCLRFIRDPKREKPSQKPARGAIIRAIKTSKVLSLLFLTYFFVIISFTGMESSLALWVKRVLEQPPQFLSWILMYTGILSIFAQGYFLGKISKAIGEKKVLITGMILFSASLSLLPFAHNLFFVFALLSSMTFGICFFTPSAQSLVSQYISEDIRGGVLGYLQALYSLSRIIGPATASFIYPFIEKNAFLVFGIIVFCALIFIFSAPIKGAAKKDAQ